MNWTEVQSEWSQFRFVLISYWNALTEQDLERIGASRDKLIAVLQERYAIPQAEAERQVADFENDIRFPGAVK